MRVVLIDLNMPVYPIALANALAQKVDLTFIEVEEMMGPWRSVLNQKMHAVIIKRPRKRNPFSVVQFSRWMNFIMELKPDILHFQNSMNAWFDLVVSLRRLPPMIVTVHDAVRHPGEPWTQWYPGLLRGPVLRKARGVIVHASEQRNLLCAEARIPTDRVHVVPHAEYGSLYRSIANLNPGVRRDPDRVLFFGRVLRYKGLSVLIEAMQIVRRKFPEAKLTIAGRGEPIGNYIPANGAKWIDVIEGFIPESEVAGIFECASMVVIPYLEASQSGVAGVAMGTGTPVIASAVGGLKEMIRDGEDGVLVPPGDAAALAAAIADLMGNAAMRNKLAQAALLRCRTDLSFEHSAARTVRIYEKVLRSA